MSGLDRIKAEQRRLVRGGRFRPEDVYSSVPTTWMQGAARSLSPAASRVLWLADARERLEAWRREYNEERPHGSLRPLTPRAFAEQAQQAREVA